MNIWAGCSQTNYDPNPYKPWSETRETCHGCDGKGWVDTKLGAERCPTCGGSGHVPMDYMRPSGPCRIIWTGCASGLVRRSE